jgi:sugar transferase (PEP-CTERM system associated)
MIRILRRSLNRRPVTLIIGDAAFITAAVVAGVWIRLGGHDTEFLFAYQYGYFKTAVVAVTCLVCLYFADVYNLRRIADPGEMFVRLMQGLGAASIALSLLYYWFPALLIGRGVVLVTSVLIIGSLASWHAAFMWLGRRLKPRERLLLVGTSQAAIALAREMFGRRDELGVDIVGFIDPDPGRVGAPILNPGVLGTVEDIPSIVRARAVDRVVVSLADARGKLPMDKLLEMKLEGVSFDHLPSVYEEYTGKIAVENLRPSWLIFSEGFRKRRSHEAAKRTLDIVIAGAAIVAMSPVMLLIAIAVRLTSKGSVFYHQQRVGLHGRVFTVHKFRSMCEDAEGQTGPVWATRNDERVTSVGRVLRRTRLDELPQFWNVLVGDMSLVGPRPERPSFVEQLTKQIPFYGQRHVVRPGLTGWAQVRYTYGASVEDALEKLQHDLFYIKHTAIAFDLFIIFATVKTVILSRGA